MKKLLVFVSLCLFFTALPVNAELTHPKSHVLLVGVDQYLIREPGTDTLKSVDFGNLEFTINDMDGLRDALVKARFCCAEDIQLLKNPTAREAETALRTMLGNVKKGDRVLVAFAGHGVSLQEGEKTVDFLCAADSKVTYDTETKKFTREGLIRRSLLEEWLDASEAEIKLIFVDACRNVLEADSITDGIDQSGNDAVIASVGNELRGIRGLGSIDGAGVFGIGEKSDIQNQGFFRSSSCAPGEFSWEFLDKQHGLFTYFLIEGMLGKADDRGRGIITLADLQKYAIDETKKFVKENNKNPSQSPVVARLSETGVTESHVLFSFVSDNLDKQVALREIDEEIGSFIQHANHPSMKQILAAREMLGVSFSQQAYQHTALLVADLRMQIERENAIKEWERQNPPPPSRARLRAAGQIAGWIAPGGGYIQTGTALGANRLEARDSAMHERRKAVMLDKLAVYSAEMGTSEGFVESQEEQRLRQVANRATLDELVGRIRPYQGRQGYQNLVNEIMGLRNDSSRGEDITSRLAELEQQIENFISEQQQRPTSVPQQRSTSRSR